MFLGSFAWSFVHVSLPFYIQNVSVFDEAHDAALDGLHPRDQPARHRDHGADLGTARRHPRSEARVRVDAGLAGRRLHPDGLCPEPAPDLLRPVPARSDGRGVDVRLYHGRAIGGRRAARGVGDPARDDARPGPRPRGRRTHRRAPRLSLVVFSVASAMLGLCAGLVGWGVPAGRGRTAPRARAGTASLRELATVCGLVLGCLTQVFFLTAILPQVLPRLGVPASAMLEVGGLVLLADGLGMALGTLAAPRVAEALGDRRAVPWLLACSSVFLALPLSRATSGHSSPSASSRWCASRRCSRSRWRPSRIGPRARPSAS